MAQETPQLQSSLSRDGAAALMASIPGVNQVTNFFQGNPMITPIGQLIERATDSIQPSENWALFLEICDVINESGEQGPRDAIRAIRKRLQVATGNRNFTTVMYTLTALETAVKNCGRRFHVQVAQKDFLKDMTNIMNPKHDPPIVVQDKILSLIQCWSIAFRVAPELRAVEQTYQDMKSRGIVFPVPDESAAPIITPKPSGQHGGSPSRGTSVRASPAKTHLPLNNERPALPAHGTANFTMASAHQQHQQQHHNQPAPRDIRQIVEMSGPVMPTPEQMAKLRSELDIVNGNIRVMGDMLSEMMPGEEDPADLELLQELNRTCRAMQTRLLELIEKISAEEVVEELLHINDDLNNAFLRFERFERYRTGKTSSATGNVQSTSAEPQQRSPSHVSPARNGEAGPPLIDFNSPTGSSKAHENTDDIRQQLATLDVAAGDKAAPAAGFGGKEDEFREMEAWLGATGDGHAAVSSSEFDDFLASRLQGGDDGAKVSSSAVAAPPSSIRSIADVPSISATSGAVSRVHRTSKKEDDQDLLLG